ncbi:MAG: hypothetical protein H6522_01570 [Mycolicibacterium sp.]|nr:hypothetical protein [Mycolicibacterium sp.]
MDTVLGLSMTPTTVGLVLVEGDGRDGTTRDHDAFEIRRGGFSPVTTSEYVAEALSRTRAIAGGQQLQSIGVTWSDDAAIEASLLLDSLADYGFRNVVPIRLPEATEAFARGIGEVIGSDVTSVCVVEPEGAVALVVDSRQNTVRSAVNYDLETDHDLTRWLSEVVNRDGWHPDGLVLLGSGEDLDEIARHLELMLGIPVFAPAEAELALARGAALASVNSIGLLDDPVFAAFPYRPKRRRMPKAQALGLSMLIGGAATFVVSASVAVGLALLPDSGPPADQRPMVKTAETPAVRPAAVPRPPAPPPQVLTPPPAEPVLPAPPPETMSEPVPEAPIEEPAASGPAQVPVEPPVAAPVEPAAPPAVAAPAAPPVVQAPTVPPVPGKPSLRERILRHLPGFRDDLPAAG